MKFIGVFEAKAHLSALVEEAFRGSDIVITRHGRPVARLVRPDDAAAPETLSRRRAAWDGLRGIGRRAAARAGA